MDWWAGDTATGVTLADVQDEFPWLDCREGVSVPYLARQWNYSGPLLAEGADPLDLRNAIRAALAAPGGGG